MRVRVARVIAAIVAATLVLTGVGGSAGAANGSRPPRQLADGLAGPLAIDLTRHGDVLVGQSFAGLLSKIDRGGAVTDLVAEPGVSAVGDTKGGRVLYTVLSEDGSSLLRELDPEGNTRTVADIGAYEAAANPDQGNAYGFEEISDECAAQWPVEELGEPQYTGIVESNPYALAATATGTYVADAAGNAILFVDQAGEIRTVAVLPPQPFVVEAEIVEGLGLPACVTGLTYNFEPVPTDVEVHRGRLYVTTLPGGPEDASLGARGSVYRIHPEHGTARQMATGFFGATDLAVAPRGTIFVTELFADRVSKVHNRGPVPVIDLVQPAAVEWARGSLYVAHDVFGSGKVVTLRP